MLRSVLGSFGIVLLATAVGESATRPLLVPGDSVPSFRVGPVRWGGPDHVLVNPRGQIAVFGRAYSDDTDFEGMWFMDANLESWWLVSEDDQPVPHLTPDDLFRHDDDDTRMSLSPRGDVVFETEVRGPSHFVEGTWTWQPETGLSLLVYDGPAPGYPAGEQLNDPLYCCGNLQGDYVINSDVSPSGVIASWVVSRDGAYQLVAQSETPAPGIPDATLLSNQITQLNATGQLTLLGRYRPIDPDLAGRDQSLWFAPDGLVGNLQIVAAAGDEAPGSADERFMYVHEAVLNDAGQVAFLARLAESGREGIWRYETNIGLQPVILAGDDVPGFPDVHFSRFDSGFQLPEDGAIIFWGVDNSGGGSIWRASIDGRLAPVARPGDTAPGSGLRFRSVDNPRANGDGQLIFEATLDGAIQSEDEGIWGLDATGTMHLIDLESETSGHLFALGIDHFDRVFFETADGLYMSDTLIVPEPRSRAVTIGLPGVALVLAIRRRVKPF